VDDVCWKEVDPDGRLPCRWAEYSCGSTRFRE
jgi:hypothetical protein